MALALALMRLSSQKSGRRYPSPPAARKTTNGFQWYAPVTAAMVDSNTGVAHLEAENRPAAEPPRYPASASRCCMGAVPFSNSGAMLWPEEANAPNDSALLFSPSRSCRLGAELAVLVEPVR